jgi:CelD/BcsL family acetyltransferase involved in cellulose biosynthesis
MILRLQDVRWSAFVRRCSDASPFHHPVWAGLLAECYGYRPLVLAVTDHTGQIVAGAPVLDVRKPFAGRRWVSLPFTDSCPLLIQDQVADDRVNLLIKEVRSKRLEAFELRAGLQEQAHVYTYTPAFHHTLTLSSNPAEVYAKFSKMHQRNIRKAERLGVTVKRGCSAFDVQTFYRLHLMTRRRLGVPIQPRRFFRLLARRLMATGLGFILVAYVNQTPVAAAVFLAWNGVLVYKYGASDPRYWEYRPNNLLFWSAIRWGCEHGYHTFDMGRTDLDDQGLRRFKNGWGANEALLTYSIIAETPNKSSSGRLEQAISNVIRRSPPWVCQAVGELVYRYVA